MHFLYGEQRTAPRVSPKTLKMQIVARNKHLMLLLLLLLLPMLLHTQFARNTSNEESKNNCSLGSLHKRSFSFFFLYSLRLRRIATYPNVETTDAITIRDHFVFPYFPRRLIILKKFATIWRCTKYSRGNLR